MNDKDKALLMTVIDIYKNFSLNDIERDPMLQRKVEVMRIRIQRILPRLEATIKEEC